MSQNVPIVAPFRGLRFNPSKIKDMRLVTAPPYDVISETGQKALYERHPNNVVRLILGYQKAGDTEQDNRYIRSAADFKSWTQDGTLIRDNDPCLYLYEQEFEVKGKGRFSRRGFLALRRVEDFGKGKICPHERTLSAPKADRLLLMKSCRANFSPIFALYPDTQSQMKGVLEPYFETSPAVDFTDEDGIRQRLWRVSDRDLFVKVNEIVGQKNLFIADGHHRYETAIAYRDWMMGLQPGSPEDASFHYVMMFFSDMSDPGLLILPTHRVLQNWKGFDPPSFEARLKEWFEIKPFSAAALANEGNAGRQAFGVIYGGIQHLMVMKDGVLDRIDALSAVAPAARRVDTMILHRLILQHVLGMKGDEDKDPRYLSFVKDANEAILTAQQPNVNCVFLLNSSPMDILRQVVEAGMVLPPKTTFFYPKLLTGLVMNQIDAEGRVSI